MLYSCTHMATVGFKGLILLLTLYNGTDSSITRHSNLILCSSGSDERYHWSISSSYTVLVVMYHELNVNIILKFLS